MDWTEGIAWLGAATLLIVYLADSFTGIGKRSWKPHLFAFLASSGLAFEAASHHVRPLFAVNIFWALAALSLTIYRFARSNGTSASPGPVHKIFWRGIPSSPKELMALALAHRENQIDKNPEKGLLLHFYECLSIIDNKSSAMLTHNSLILAILALFGSSDFWGFDKKGRIDLIAAFLIFISIATSSLLALKTVYIRWSSPSELSSPMELAKSLLKVRAERTVDYRIAFALSAVGSLTLAILVGAHMILNINDAHW